MPEDTRAQEHRVKDCEARSLAVHAFDRPLSIEAGAGTGKTATLVARVLAWCLGPGWARHEGTEYVAGRVLDGVAAITFTEKAAAEMSARVASGLASIAEGKEVIGLDGALDPLDPSVRERAAALLAEADRVRVQTIHSFCGALLRSWPLEAGISPSFEVDADGSALREIVREVLVEKVGALVADLEPEVELLWSEGIGPRQWGDALESLASADVTAEDLAEVAPDVRAAGAVDAIGRDLLAIDEALSRVVDAGTRFESSRERISAICEGLDTNEGIDARVAILSDSLGGLESALGRWASGKFYSATRLALTEDEQIAVQDAAARILRAVEELGGAGSLGALLPERFAALMAVLEAPLDAVRETLRRRGVLTFDGLLGRARALLSGHEAVLLAVRERIDQLLVDEFQDTDPVQCDIVRMIGLDPAPGRRPGLFVVGDPKQSIYGWRSADLDAYQGFVDELKAAGGSVAPLSVNFRSVPAVLDEVARAVGPVMDGTPDFSPPFQPLLPCAAFEEEPGFTAASTDELVHGCAAVEYWVAGFDPGRRRKGLPEQLDLVRAGGARLREADALARHLRALHDAGLCGWGDVGVLMRTTTAIELWLEAFRAHSVPYVVRGEKSYYQRREVQDAVALVSAVLDRGDLLSAVAWLRSPAVGVPDAAWWPLWELGLPERLVGLDGPRPETMAELDRLVEGAAARVHARASVLVSDLPDWPAGLRFGLRALATLRASARSEPTDTFVERLRAYSLAEPVEASRYLGRHRVARLRRFYEVLRAVLSDTGGGPHAVASELRHRLDEPKDESVDTGDTRDAVTLSTIHAAKGLAWEQVFLVDVERGLRRQSGGDRDVRRHEGRLALCLFGAASDNWPEACARSELVARGELVRTLYVALTRAKRRLVVTGAWPLGPVGPYDAASHAQLLSSRYPFLDDEGAFLAPEEVDVFDVLWRQLPEPGPRGAAGLDREAPPWLAGWLARVEADAGLLEAALAKAARRQDLPMLESVTGLEGRRAAEPAGAGSEGDDDELAPPPTAEDEARRSLAIATGITVHRAIELLDLDLPPSDAVDAVLARLRRLLPSSLPEELRGLCLDSASSLLRAFAPSPLCRRLYASEVLARELPLLVPPGSRDEAIGAVVGTADLLLREPATGAVVVADLKTDAVRDESEAHARAGRYSTQARLYSRAVKEALGLDEAPRFELWFLRAGCAVEVEG